MRVHEVSIFGWIITVGTFQLINIYSKYPLPLMCMTPPANVKRRLFDKNNLPLVISGVVLLMAIAIASSIADPDAPATDTFAWQKRCDAACGAAVGEIGMRGIERSTSCLTLQAELDIPCYKYKPEVCNQWKDAVQDQMDYRHCPGSSEPRAASDPYQPSYAWQKRCQEDCANNLGKEEMKNVDRYDCVSISDKLPYAHNPKLWSDYDQNYDWYAEESKAVLDKYDSLNCA